jgi:hypothetical protein
MGEEGQLRWVIQNTFKNFTQFLMKKIFVLFLLALSICSYGQSRIGSHIKAVRAEYSDPAFNLKSMVHDTSTFLVLQDKHAVVIHRFGKDSICNKTYVTPEDTTIAYQMASTYDAIYQPVSRLEWIVRQPKDILDVELVSITNKDGSMQPTFQWTRAKK